MEPSQMLSTAEAAEYLGISKQTLLRLVNSGDLPFYTLGKRRRFHIEDLNNAFKPSNG